MFHKAINLKLLKGTQLEVEFTTGEVKRYDMMRLVNKYPIVNNLKNRELFLSGKLLGNYGIRWNDDIDIETETIYEDGKLVSIKEVDISTKIGNLVCEARNKEGLTQNDLAKISGIDQSDISKLERGLTNPSVGLLERIAESLNQDLDITFKQKR